jgi:peptidoglycan/xylan/chitin deacetylase (PgdA/CDA1 family)
MGKAAARNLLAQTCRAMGILGTMERSARKRLNILCYHRVLPAADKAAYFCPDLVVTPETLRNHCRTLAEYYEVLPLTEAVEALGTRVQDKPLIALTFDDGYVDNLQFAVPILKEHGLRATFFVVSGLMGAQLPPWYDLVARCAKDLENRGEGSTLEGNRDELSRNFGSMKLVQGAKGLAPELRQQLVDNLLQRLGQPPDFQPQDLVMDPSQVQVLATLGHEIGSHSVSHEILPLLEANSLEREIRLSKEQLEETVQMPITSFCFPNGDFDERVLDIVKSCGYSNAVTTLTGANDIGAEAFTLRRRFVHEGRLANGREQPSSTLFRAEISGLNDRLLRWRLGSQ